MRMRRKQLILGLGFLALVGFLDAAYLTYQHYAKIIPPCPADFPFLDCGTVLTSQYATIGPVPIALLGALHYALLMVLAVLALLSSNKIMSKLILALTTIALLFSLYLVYLQLFVLEAVCFYCMVSVLDSGALFIVALFLTRESDKSKRNA